MASVVAQSASAACTAAVAFKFDKNTQVTALTIPSYQGTILHYRAAQNLDGDGAATAYSVDPDNPNALETICVGANAYLGPTQRISGILAGPERKKLKAQGKSDAELRRIGHERCEALKAAYARARAVDFRQDVFPVMDFYAIATPSGRRRDVPCPAVNGFFVSTTSQTADSSASLCSAAHWLDPIVYPAIVIPGQSPFTQDRRYAIRSGVLALVRYHDTLAPAIVGDIGPPYGLGEMTYKLAWDLLGRDMDTTTMTSAQIKEATRHATLDAAVDYYLLVDSSIEHPTGRLASPATRSKISRQMIGSAFGSLDVARIERDLTTCTF